MLFIINITWHRRTPEAGRPQTGRATYAMTGRTFNAAKAKAVRKFNRHFGMHLAVDDVSEFQDPAGILTNH